MADYRHEILAFFTRWWIWCCYILVGIGAKFCHDLMRNKKISFGQSIGSIGLAGFVGYLATMLCVSYGVSAVKGGVIVPVATLLSREVISWLFTRNWSKIFDSIYEGFKNKTP